MTTHGFPAAGCVVDRPSRRRALIPRECWADAWDSATRTVGGIALAVVVLAVIRLTYPLGVLLLAASQGATP